MASPSQKALFLEAKQGAWVVRDKPIPKAVSGHVVVKNLAVALNPVEWKIREYGLFVTEYPTVVGVDAAGIIEEVGDDVVQWKKGDRVLYQGYFGPDKNTFQQYTIVPADVVGKLPDGFDVDGAATMPVCVATAAAGLYQYKGSDDVPAFTPPWLPGGEGKYAGQAIVILGGATSVGQYAIQWAKLSGFSSIITTASPRNEQLVKYLGATHFIDRSSATVVADTHSILSSTTLRGPRIVYDAVSEKETQEVGLEIVEKGGVLVTVIPSELDPEKVKGEGKHVFHVIGNVQMPHLRDFGYSMYAALPKLLEEGKIEPNAYDIVANGFDGIASGLKDLQDNKVSGKKLVSHPFDTRV